MWRAVTRLIHPSGKTRWFDEAGGRNQLELRASQAKPERYHWPLLDSSHPHYILMMNT